MLSLVGPHMTRNGLGPDYPSRACLSMNGNGLDEQHYSTIILYRDTTVYNDGPADLHTNPQRRTIEFARWWYQDRRQAENKPCLREVWLANASRTDYFTITNELGGSNPEHILDHIAYEANICQLAAADGLKCAVGKLAGDSPDWNTNLWEELYAPFIVGMWNQYGAVYARHVYGGDLVDGDGNPTQDAPGNPSRPFFEANYLRMLGYGGGMVLAECGIDGGYGLADYGRFRAQVLGYEAALRPYADIIIGLCWWECGTSGFEANYTRHLQDLRPLLDTSLPKWEGKEMSDKPKIVIVKKPQKADMLESENERANLYAWINYGRTTTHSHDDMLTMLAAGNDESYAVVCWPERQPDTVQMLESAGYDWVMFPEEVPPPAAFSFTHWPTPHRVVTQRFRNNPSYYSQFGLPGHEGVDIRAYTGDPIYSVADGVVSNRHDAATGHNYGRFIRISHPGGYETTYAHCQSLEPLAVGVPVKGGQLIARADNTGNSQGSHLHLTLKQFPQNAPDRCGIVWPSNMIDPEPYLKAFSSVQWISSEVPCQSTPPTPPGRTVDMLPYFSPPAGTPYGPVTIKDTNWGQGQVRQQIQAHGDYLYVTKGKEFEARKLIGDRIFLITDDSPGNGKYYTVQSVDGWIPRHFTEGQSFTRKETATFFYKSNCSATGESSNWSNVIRFTKFYPTWQTPAGLSFNNVCHLQWLVNGVLEEDYWLAPHVGYVMWGNRHGRQGYVVDMPQGQGNNVFRGACYWPAFGKEW